MAPQDLEIDMRSDRNTLQVLAKEVIRYLHNEGRL